MQNSDTFYILYSKKITKTKPCGSSQDHIDHLKTSTNAKNPLVSSTKRAYSAVFGGLFLADPRADSATLGVRNLDLWRHWKNVQRNERNSHSSKVSNSRLFWDTKKNKEKQGSYIGQQSHLGFFFKWSTKGLNNLQAPHSPPPETPIWINLKDQSDDSNIFQHHDI